MVGSVGSVQSQAINLLQTRQAEIWKKLKSGDTETAIVTGGNAFTETTWDKMITGVDNYLDEVKAEQKIRFARMEEEQEEKALLDEKLNAKELLNDRTTSSEVPYGYLAKDGVIEYNGVIFTCDEQNNAICLGDTSNPEDCINIPLSDGGCLIVNRDNIDDLSKAISMFSPEDIRRIMEAIAQDAKCQQMQLQIDETVGSVSGSTTIVSEGSGEDVVTAEQIAKLFEEKEE